MRRRYDQRVMSDPGAVATSWHSAGERQVIQPVRLLEICDVPELWRQHASQPWRVLFPDLDWAPPAESQE